MQQQQQLRLCDHFDGETCSQLEQLGIGSFERLLEHPFSSLQKAIPGRTALDIENLLREASRLYLSARGVTPGHPVSRMAHGWLPIGCQGIDGILRGGLAVGTITEVAGAAGTGKTQLAIQWMIRAALAGGTVVYVTTEGSPHPAMQRLKAMAQAIAGTAAAASVSSRVYVEVCKSAEDQERVVRVKLNQLLARDGKVNLIVLDSIAGVMRADGEEAIARSESLFSQAAQLKRLAHRHKLAVLVTNQVTESMAAEENAAVVVPAMGLAWATCITTRIVLSKSGPGAIRETHDADPPEAKRRKLGEEELQQQQQQQPHQQSGPVTMGVRRTGNLLSGYVEPPVSTSSVLTASAVLAQGSHAPPSPQPQQQPAAPIQRTARIAFSSFLALQATQFIIDEAGAR
jgi:RecA/RadA recombinase